MKIDFIAGHDLQAQCGESVFTELEKLGHECKWHINPGQDLDAEAIVMLDHAPHHPKLKAKYKFYLSHDMGDLSVYHNESWYLREYDAIFTPTNKHAVYAQQWMPWCEVEYIGWTKYDIIKPLDISLDNEIVFIYAPTNPRSYEWKKVFEWFKDSDAGLIIKNHLLLNPGQKAPLGYEQQYKMHFKSRDEMEAAAAGMKNTIVLSHDINLCDTFKQGRILISDQSSALVEFTPFGVSLETGRYDESDNILPENSKNWSGIYFVCDAELKATIQNPEIARQKISCHAIGGDVEFRQDNGKRIAEYMHKYFRRVKK